MPRPFVIGFFRHRLARAMLWTGVACGVFALAANVLVNRFGRDVFSDVSQTPAFKVGLLLGTSKQAQHGPNLYYENRLEAAATLYHAGKIQKIIASGDGSSLVLCEPEQMRDDLIARGIPAEDIVLDYAGLRTLDSVVRCKAVFGTDDFLVISQDFHCRRALFIAHANGIRAKGFAAADVRARSWALRNHTREFIARTAALVDVAILHRGPRHYGEPIAVFPAKDA